MFQLSRQTVRQNRSLYAGSFVALAVGVFLLGLTATTIASTVESPGAAGPSITVEVPSSAGGTEKIAVPLADNGPEGLQSLLGFVSTISAFVTVFVIASTFAFAVASRRRELGLLRLIGATPRQIRRMILGEAVVVAVAASLTGAILAQLVTPLVLAKASYTEFAPLKLEPASPWVPLAIAVGAGLLVALLGARSAARRAGRIGPVDALREASLEPPRIGPVRTGSGLVFLAGSIVLLALIRPGTGEAVIPLAMFTPMLLVIALTLLAPLLVPLVSRPWAMPFVAWTRVSGRLARSNVLAAPRRSASLAAPILAISAIAGAMVLTLSFAADASAAIIRDTVRAPIVVTPPAGSADLAERLRGTPGVGLVDAGLPIEVVATEPDSAQLDDAEGIDPAVAVQTRRITVLSGDLDRLTGHSVAVSKERAGLSRVGVGDALKLVFVDGTPANLRVVAVVADAFEVNPGLLLPLELARAHAKGATPERYFVQPAAGVSADQLIRTIHASTGATAVPAEVWENAQSEQVRAGNQLGLALILGPGALYSGIAIVNTLLMGSLQRRREFVTSRLLGATPAQLRRMVLWESTLVGLVALSLGTAITLTVGLLIRNAMASGLRDVPVTVPWGPLLGIGGVCLALAIGAALLPAAVILRRAQPAAATE